MRRLIEKLELQLAVPEANASPIYENMLSRWSSVEYPQLSVLLVHLRHVAVVLQECHWQAKGDAFYGDHKMFGELYEATLEHVDNLAEKAVGLGTNENVSLKPQLQMLNELVQGSHLDTVPHSSDLARRALTAEVNFLRCARAMTASLREAGTLTDGLGNLLAGLEDVHEQHVYHLKQRCS